LSDGVQKLKNVFVDKRSRFKRKSRDIVLDRYDILVHTLADGNQLQGSIPSTAVIKERVEELLRPILYNLNFMNSSPNSDVSSD